MRFDGRADGTGWKHAGLQPRLRRRPPNDLCSGFLQLFSGLKGLEQPACMAKCGSMHTDVATRSGHMINAMYSRAVGSPVQDGPTAVREDLR